MRGLALAAVFLVWLPQAKAVIVRGKVTSPLGVPLPGARVQLIQGPRSVGDAIAGTDGGYEIRVNAAGRFVLLTAPPMFAGGYAPQVGTPFYAGRADLVTKDIALNPAGITPQVSEQETLREVPLARLDLAPVQVAHDELLTQVSVIPELETTADAEVVQRGEMGTPAYLYPRGAPPQTVLVEIDGVAANGLGEGLNLSTLSTAGLGAISPEPGLELGAAAHPLYFTGAESGILTVRTSNAEALRPTLTYTGDAGGLDALHNEAVASYAHRRYDLLGGFSRFDVANSLPAEPFHVAGWAADAGYQISAGTSIRLKARDDFAASRLASPFAFFGVAPEGRDAHQGLESSGTFETRTAGQWHNVVRYGLARERGQVFDYATPANGLPVTIHGANGYAATGTAVFDALPRREDRVTNRDAATWQTDYAVKPWLGALGEIRVEDERAADVLPAGKSTLERVHFSGAGGLQGGIKQRFFYAASGFVDHTERLGFTGSPRLGMTYAPVRPGVKKFRGTSLHLTLATGTREPSLLEQAANPAGLETPRSRMLSAAVDQSVLSQKLTVRAGYFHSQYSHEFEPVGLSPVASQALLSQTLALRTQGFDGEVRYQPKQRILLAADYMYLAALTERSAAAASFNPDFPGVRIGGLTALAGQRPFYRPPQSASFVAEYSGTRLNLSLNGQAVSRSDDSTELVETPGLLLPNRNLSPRYCSVDAHATFQLTRRIAVFTQMTNLTDDRHVAPIGYLSTPFLLRSGVRIRLGGE